MLLLDPAIIEKYGDVVVVTYDQIPNSVSYGYTLLAVVEQQTFVPVPEAPSHIYPRPPPEPPKVLSTCLFVLGRERDVAGLHARLEARDTKVHQLEDELHKLTRDRDALVKEVDQLKLAQRLADAGDGGKK